MEFLSSKCSIPDSVANDPSAGPRLRANIDVGALAVEGEPDQARARANAAGGAGTRAHDHSIRRPSPAAGPGVDADQGTTMRSNQRGATGGVRRRAERRCRRRRGASCRSAGRSAVGDGAGRRPPVRRRARRRRRAAAIKRGGIGFAIEGQVQRDASARLERGPARRWTPRRGASAWRARAAQAAARGAQLLAQLAFH